MSTIDLDADLGNADWTKQTWDLPCETEDELDNYLEMNGIDPAEFRLLPAYQAAPWLTDDVPAGSLTGDSDEEILVASFTALQRKRFAKSGVAMPDGSFPIRNSSDLHNAVMSLGRSNHPDAAKAHIISRAKTLGLVEELPEDWEAGEKPDSDDNMAAAAARSGATVTLPLEEFEQLRAAMYDESKHPRAPKGSKGGGRWIVETRQGGKIVVEAGSEMEAIAKASDAVEAGDYGQSTKDEQGADLRAGRATAEPVEGDTPQEAYDNYDMPEGWTKPDGSPWATVREQTDAIHAAQQKSGDWRGKAKAQGGDILDVEQQADKDLADQRRAESAARRDALGIPDQPGQRRPGEARPKSEAFDKAVPLATDTPTRPGQVVRTDQVRSGDLEPGDSIEMHDGEYEVVKNDSRGFTVRNSEGATSKIAHPIKVKRKKGGNLTASAAGLVPVHPPAQWFNPPAFDSVRPLEVTADGQVRGYLAGWGTCHIGDPRGRGVCVEPPSSKTDYGYFHLGQVVTADGAPVSVGQITLDTGHAPLGLNARTAAAHYDNTGTAVADVRVGEDAHGIWVAGALRPSVSAEKARALTAAKLSGDWRGIQGNLEMVGILAVNVPGFPIPRAEVRLAASAAPDEDERLSLVAAGIVLVDPAAAEAHGEAMALRILGRDALLAAALPRSYRRPQTKEQLERAKLTAAAWDESKHPRHERGKSEGGKFAPAHGGSSTPSVSPDERTVDDKQYDGQVDSTADSILAMTDDFSAEHFNYEGDEPTDQETLDAYNAGYDQLVGDDAYSDALAEGAAAAGIDISDEEAMFEDGSPYMKFEEDVNQRMADKAPVMADVLGIPQSEVDQTGPDSSIGDLSEEANPAPAKGETRPLIDMSNRELRDHLKTIPDSDLQARKMTNNVLNTRMDATLREAGVKKGKGLIDLSDEQLRSLDKKLSSDKNSDPQLQKLVANTLKMRKPMKRPKS